jgi:PPOX class probable F420-dependent enzyme
MTAGLDAPRRHDTVLLTTHRRDGRAVTTPASSAFDGDRAFVRTWDTAGKAKRLRRDPNVEVAPSTFLLVPLIHRLRGNTTVHYELEDRRTVATRRTQA